MADVLTTLETQLTELRSIRARGVARVQYTSGSVEYRSDGEIASAIADLESRIAGLRHGGVHVTYFKSSKGF